MVVVVVLVVLLLVVVVLVVIVVVVVVWWSWFLLWWWCGGCGGGVAAVAAVAIIGYIGLTWVECTNSLPFPSRHSTRGRARETGTDAGRPSSRRPGCMFHPHPIGRPPPAAYVSKATHTNSIVDAKDTTATPVTLVVTHVADETYTCTIA